MKHNGSSFAGRVWRSVAASLLLLLLSAMAVPIVQAQDPDNGLPPCCRMMNGRAGCNMRMHHAAMQHDHSHEVASVQERCPCTPLVQSGATAHDLALTPTSAELAQLPRARAPSVVPLPPASSHRHGGEETRGPPTRLTA